ncbi:MAG: methionyl-tRNA formyltransferase [Candidatus Nealsonbacteria bacterium]|nr:methionyl-tRNA formyltransferase [Candidatus Nealsonbacteria bacterium]
MENNKIKIVFIGTPEFGAVILEKLCQANMAPILVITEIDKPVGRKQIITSSPVKIMAESYKIPVLQPEKIINSALEIKNFSPKLIVVASYGQILPKEILDIPKYGSLNVHPSLLPKYRGPSPIQSAILKGEIKTGVTIMLVDEQMDHGPILAQKQTTIGLNETAKQLHDRLAILGAEVLIDTIPDWLAGRIKARLQDGKKATYTKILIREAGLIDWQKSPQEIERQIRAFNPWPGTYAMHKGKRIKILQARLENGKLIIERVQPEGKKPMNLKEFLRGNPDSPLKHYVNTH